MRVKPVDPCAIIRDPHTKRALPAEGGKVPANNFWTRRLNAGEVVLVEDTTDQPAVTEIEPEPPTTHAER